MNKPVRQQHPPRPSLRFVRAINFELTYQCNLSCSHCIQQKIREFGRPQWINTVSVCRALEEGHTLGFTSMGVNFTGGEPFLPKSNLLELIEKARRLGLDVRINTNGWWGREKDIRLGRLRFATGGRVVAWLRRMGVAALALSFDGRYDDNPGLWDSVVAVIRECESQGQQYQIIFTGTTSEEIEHAWCRLTVEEGITPNHMIPVQMEMVDLGGASSVQGDEMPQTLFCNGKGFYRPRFLHISPSGGVRTCMCAPQAQWLGNINDRTLFDIAEDFADNGIIRAFSSRPLDQLAETYLPLFSRARYRLPQHPCAVSVLIARAIEESEQFASREGTQPSGESLSAILDHVAKDCNLQRD